MPDKANIFGGSPKYMIRVKCNTKIQARARGSVVADKIYRKLLCIRIGMSQINLNGPELGLEWT